MSTWPVVQSRRAFLFLAALEPEKPDLTVLLKVDPRSVETAARVQDPHLEGGPKPWW